jgi:hypothetical protein
VAQKLKEVYKGCSRKEYCEECLDMRQRERENSVGYWRKLPNQEYHDLCFSPGIVSVMKSMRIRGVTHLAPTADNRIADGSLVGKPERNRSLET